MENKKAYLFNENNEFICEIDAQVDPLALKLLNKIEYIKPENSTLEPVIEEKEGFIRKFDGGKWFYEKIIIEEPEPQPEPVLTYADLRRAEYPSYGEQLDMIYWDKINNTNNWVDTITDIKNKYPKE